MKQMVKDDILKRNPFLKPLVDAGQTFDVVVLKEELTSYTVVIKISPEVRNLININGNKLFISLSRCEVKDRFHFIQCFHCQRIGHISTNCPDKAKMPVCMYCAGSHSSKMCEVNLSILGYCYDAHLWFQRRCHKQCYY